MTDTLTSPFAAGDLNAVRVTLDGIGVSADKVSKSLTSAFASAVVSGKSFDQTLQGVIASLSKVALTASLKPFQEGLSALLGAAISSLGSAMPGGGRGPITPFAEGGVVSRPTFFGSGGGVGLMGERGAEAILPLARGPDGRLGVAGGGRSGSANVTINISTPDVESFRRSSVQVSSALASAVARGQRGL